MRQVVVSVRREEDEVGPDLELPTDLRADELARQVGQALGWRAAAEGTLHVRIGEDGRVLRRDETLVDARVADGAWLIFTAAEPEPAPVLPEPEPELMPEPQPVYVREPDLTPRPWPPFVPPRPQEQRAPPLLPAIIGVVAAVLIFGGAVWIARPRTSTTATPVPTPVPTLEPTALPTPEPTLVPTLAPTAIPTPLPTAIPTLAPTSVPTPVPTALPTLAPTAVPDAATLWPVVAAQLDPMWGPNWPAAIELSGQFVQRFPDYAPASEKLYAALIEYGRQLRAQGQPAAARAAFDQASNLAPDRPEARDELAALTPTPSPAPVAQPTAIAPQIVTPLPVIAPPVNQPPVVVDEPAAPMQKQNVTRDGFDPGE